MRSLCAVAFVAATLATGCTAVGPDYERPPVEVPKLMPGLADVNGVIPVTSAEPWERWWEAFHDDQLTTLIGQAHVANMELRASVARVHAARAVVRQAFAPLLPRIGADAAYSYQKFAINAIPFNPSTGGILVPGAPSGGGGISAPGPTTTFSFLSSPFQVFAATTDMNYELDVWGRIRRQLEAAQAEEQATEEEKASVQITVMADVASAYFDVGAAAAELAIVEEGIDLRVKTLELIRDRFETGLANELDLRKAEAAVSRARADVPEARKRRALAEHRLAVLLGHPPVLHFGSKPPASFELPPTVPVGIPASLLERRPDVRAAEARVRANNARIGAALAEFFPKVTIFGRVGFASIDPAKLGEYNSLVFAAGPSIHFPIFEGGRNWAQLLEAEARTDEATLLYYNAALNALREVADALVAFDSDQRMRDHLRDAVAASERSVEVATSGYDQGVTSYLNVLDAQRTLLEVRLSLLRAQRMILGDLVQLGKALGGGWTVVPDEGTPAKSGT